MPNKGNKLHSATDLNNFMKPPECQVFFYVIKNVITISGNRSLSSSPLLKTSFIQDSYDSQVVDKREFQQFVSVKTLLPYSNTAF